MPDSAYAIYNLIFKSLGVTARPRWCISLLPVKVFSSISANLEEVEENVLATRLGSTLIVKSRDNPLATSRASPLPFQARLLSSPAYRYAGSGTGLYRLAGLNPGAYSQISSVMSGQPWMGVPYAPIISSLPYLYIADANGVIKDNGTLAAPQKANMLQPQYPVQAQAQPPTYTTLDNYPGPNTNYTYTGISGGTIVVPVNTTLTAAVTATGSRPYQWRLPPK